MGRPLGHEDFKLSNHRIGCTQVIHILIRREFLCSMR